jgi:hypothetical protein
MAKEKLEQMLYGRPANVFAVLDGASVKGLPMILFEKRPPHYCLFTGELKPDMAEVAPYLVGLVRGAPFTDWLLNEKPGRHQGIFAVTLQSITEMRRHFRSLFMVYKEDGDPMQFRFYDPRVTHSYLPTCNPGELKSFFGSIDTLYAEIDDGSAFAAYRLDGNELKRTEIKLEGD